MADNSCNAQIDIKTSVAGEKGLPKVTVLFDGSCPLCSAEISVYKEADNEGCLHFLDVAQDGIVLPQNLDKETAMSRFHVIGTDGSLFSGARAFTELWSHLKGWRWLASAAKIPGGYFILEHIYRLFLIFRPAISRLFAFAKRLL